MPEQNSFSVKGRLPSLNEYVLACRTHWSKGAALKQETETLIFWSIKSAQNKGLCHPVTHPVVVAFLWHEHGRKRDADNIYSAKKYILDAMQTAGVIPNDNRKNVVDCVDLGIVPAEKGKDGVDVVIMEANPDEWNLRKRLDVCMRALSRYDGDAAFHALDRSEIRERADL